MNSNPFSIPWFCDLQCWDKFSEGSGKPDSSSDFNQKFARHRNLVHLHSSFNEDREHHEFYNAVRGLERRTKQYFRLALEAAFRNTQNMTPPDAKCRKVTRFDYFVELGKPEIKREGALIDTITDRAYGLEFTRIVVLKMEIRNFFQHPIDAYSVIFYHD